MELSRTISRLRKAKKAETRAVSTANQVDEDLQKLFTKRVRAIFARINQKTSGTYRVRLIGLEADEECVHIEVTLRFGNETIDAESFASRKSHVQAAIASLVERVTQDLGLRKYGVRIGLYDPVTPVDPPGLY